MTTHLDRAFETTQTQGTGTYRLLGAAAANLRTLVAAAKVVTGDPTGPWSVNYTIDDDADYEIGVGMLSEGTGPGGEDELTRDEILDSSNGGSAVNWGAGTRNAFGSFPAADLASLSDSAASDGILEQTAARTYTRNAIPLAVAKGGTGGATAAAARSSLSAQEDVVTTRGDLVARDASAAARLAIGAAGTFLKSDGTDPAWSALPAERVEDVLVARLEWVSATQVKLAPAITGDVLIGIDGAVLKNTGDLTFDITTDLESGQTEAASKAYYLYVEDSSGTIVAHISATAPAPYGAAGAKHGYHPGTGNGSTTWRCVGTFWNDSGSNIEEFVSNAGWARFKQRDSDHMHVLGTTQPTAWTSQSLSVPKGSDAVELLSNIRCEDSSAVFGTSDAAGTLPAGSGPHNLSASGMEGVQVKVPTEIDGVQEQSGERFELPISDPNSPGLRWGILREASGSVDYNHLRVMAYHDRWAPRF